VLALTRKAAAKIGIDKAIAYTVLGRVIQAGGGVATLFFIARFLTKAQQGYLYTFSSLLAIQVFFELGLNTIIVQFVAHEKAHLEWKDGGVLEGERYNLSRLSSLLHFFSKWFLIISGCVFVVLSIIGFIFFSKYNNNQHNYNWIIPWLILVLGTSSSLMISPYLAFLEGLGKVKEIAKARMAQQITGTLASIALLVSNFGLYVTGVTDLLTITCLLYFLLNSKYLKMFKGLWREKGEWKIDYLKEVFPFQWKIALSWISGYFIFQLFNPVTFATQGAVAAGQMGMTLSALGGVAAIAMSWNNTKIPLFSNLISRKEYKELDRIFFKTTLQSLLIIGLGLVTLIGLVYFLQSNNYPLGKRFLPLMPIIYLSITTFINQFVFSAAVYLRCHKAEPLLVYSVVIAVIYGSAMLLFSNLYGVTGLSLSNCLVTVLFSMPWVAYIFNKKRVEWHQA
jgi:O-antigen/teichoic acid export membrane protein